MATDSPYIDDSGDVPSIKAVKFVTTLVGIPAYAWLSGIIDAILTWGSGFNTTLRAMAAFETGAVGMLFAGLGEAGRIAWLQNATFIAETFGIFAPLAAIGQTAILLIIMRWILLAGLQKLLSPGWF